LYRFGNSSKKEKRDLLKHEAVSGGTPSKLRWIGKLHIGQKFCGDFFS
jgi:hypothetical protein